MLNTGMPTVTGFMRESPDYQILGVGFTDRLFLLGHADIELNDPQQVLSIQDAVNLLGADDDSPLLRALLEAYYAGARDIWLVAIAPMSEYEPDLTKRLTPNSEWGNKTYYEQYAARLTATYSMLETWDLPQLVVLVEASFYNTGDADLFSELDAHCVRSFDATGVFRFGILGTRGLIDQAAVDALITDTRPDTVDGRFTMVVVGDGTMNLQEIPVAYSTSVVSSIAGQLSTLPLDRGLTSRVIPNVIAPSQQDFTKAQLISLTNKKFNPILRTSEGRRGQLFQAMLLTDNTMGQNGTDFWSLLQMRLVSKTAERIRALGNRALGTIGFGQFKQEVERYLVALVAQGSIRGYELNIYRDRANPMKAYVDYSLQPYFGLREIVFMVEVGPGAGA